MVSVHREELVAYAAQRGFDRVVIGQIPVCERWAREQAQIPCARWQDLTPDARLIAPYARRVVVLMRSYRPYKPVAGEAFVSPYYLTSNQSYIMAKDVCAWMNARGAQTVFSERFPYKPTACLLGAGQYGRNCLLSRPETGTRFVMQMLLTDAPLTPDDAPPREGLTDKCRGCARCLRACPTGALKTGVLNPALCLRAQSESQPVPPGLRAMIGRNLLGCELCQTACPKNAFLEAEDMPDNLLRALSLPALLAGDVSGLAEIVGRNFARKKRTQARACLIAANLGRDDCLPLLSALTDDDFTPLREHARWAVKRLEGN